MNIFPLHCNLFNITAQCFICALASSVHQKKNSKLNYETSRKNSLSMERWELECRNYVMEAANNIKTAANNSSRSRHFSLISLNIEIESDFFLLFKPLYICKSERKALEKRTRMKLHYSMQKARQLLSFAMRCGATRQSLFHLLLFRRRWVLFSSEVFRVQNCWMIMRICTHNKSRFACVCNESSDYKIIQMRLLASSSCFYLAQNNIN